MSSLKTLIFFATPEHECSYLEGRDATTMFVDPRAQVDKRLYSQLTALGFRRSGSHYYRPHCETCTACIPVRIPAKRFKANRNQRRILKTNSDLEFRLAPVQYRDEYYELYDRYISRRHKDGDMFPPTRDQFRSFLVEGAIDSFFLEMRHPSLGLLALAVVDLLDDGLSAIYTLFEPDAEERSLGTLAVLWQIEEARRRSLPHVYLGYWIRECQKMSYKTRFQPLEKLSQGRWVDVLATG